MISEEQRCEAAQALWLAVNRMLDKQDPRASEWLYDNGYDQMRYRCRCKLNLEAFCKAREMTQQGAYTEIEDFAEAFLNVCVNKHSMNVNKQWKKYWEKELDRIREAVCQKN